MDDTTHYDCLGVNSASSREEIKVAFHSLARTHHPDRQVAGDAASATQMLRIQLAWECLRDSEKRKAYDDLLQNRSLKSKMNETKAIDIRLSDLEEVEDEEAGERGYTYECRCGDYIEVWETDLTESCLKAGCEVGCPGCCFVYRIVKP